MIGPRRSSHTGLSTNTTQLPGQIVELDGRDRPLPVVKSGLLTSPYSKVYRLVTAECTATAPKSIIGLAYDRASR